MSHNDSPQNVEGMFLLLDNNNEPGLKHWRDELAGRHIPAVIMLSEAVLDNNRELVKSLYDRGFEIGGCYNDGPFWNESYDSQYEITKRVKDKIQSFTDEPMLIFCSKYFAYNENTLRVADTLGIKYILARGTAGIRGVVYQPHEYHPKIVSVSNVPSKKLGTGSLCDESLRCRGEGPDYLRDLLLSLRERRVIVVAQTHVSGVKLHWWNVFQDFLDAGIVIWKSLHEFGTEVVTLPATKIPINTRTDYTVPKPRIPLEQEEDYPFEER